MKKEILILAAATVLAAPAVAAPRQTPAQELAKALAAVRPYAGGKLSNGFFYNVAITNPERDESVAGVSSAGTATNNSLSYWGNAGYRGKLQGGWNYAVAGSFGVLPDQGGPAATGLGKGDSINVYSLWTTVTNGAFDFEAEYLDGTDQHGVSATQDAKPKGFWIQPAYKITPTLEAVVRYSEIYAGRRGVTISDGTRSAPSTAAMKSANEWYYGFSYLFRGNETKFQIGYVHAESKDALTGASASAKSDGIRSQMQVNF